jgi:rhodanese-related sulfurtransferase
MTYAGDVTPQDAYAAVTGPERGVLVDVRTRAEWTYVGTPILPEDAPPLLLIEWVGFPDGAVNSSFVEQLRDAGIQEGTPLYFLCRSGVRSVAAATAATAAGLGPAHNILEGFEGVHDDQGHRTVTGWKNAGLPWKQG